MPGVVAVGVHVPDVRHAVFLEIRVHALTDADQALPVAAREPQQLQLVLGGCGVGHQFRRSFGVGRRRETADPGECFSCKHFEQEETEINYFVQAINVLSSDDFPAKDLALIIGRASEDLPRSLDLLAAPESSLESQTSGDLGTALLTLWIKIEFLGQAQDDKMTAADLSRKLRLANARG